MLLDIVFQFIFGCVLKIYLIIKNIKLEIKKLLKSFSFLKSIYHTQNKQNPNE